MKKIFYLCYFSLFLFGCSKPKIDQKNAIYIWDERSYYSYLSKEELSFIKENNIQDLYCKLTDVNWSDQYHAFPDDTKDLPSDVTLKAFLNVIPCVFITNEVMLKSTKNELEYMSEKIAARIIKYDTATKWCQVDCDWSAQSKENYFYFLTNLKKHLKGIKVSITLRLFQYRYPEKTGVPPAERAMLMLYNFNSPTAYRKENSIFDYSEAKKYTSDIKYPLPLDFALPSFSWKVLYSHENKFLGFLSYKGDPKVMSYLKEISPNTFQVTADTVVDNYYLRNGNKLKVEKITLKELKEAYSLINEFSNCESYTVALFDLNEQTLDMVKDDESLYNTISTK